MPTRKDITQPKNLENEIYVTTEAQIVVVKMMMMMENICRDLLKIEFVEFKILHNNLLNIKIITKLKYRMRTTNEAVIWMIVTTTLVLTKLLIL